MCVVRVSVRDFELPGSNVPLLHALCCQPPLFLFVLHLSYHAPPPPPDGPSLVVRSALLPADLLTCCAGALVWREGVLCCVPLHMLRPGQGRHRAGAGVDARAHGPHHAVPHSGGLAGRGGAPHLVTAVMRVGRVPQLMVGGRCSEGWVRVVVLRGGVSGSAAARAG